MSGLSKGARSGWTYYKSAMTLRDLPANLSWGGKVEALEGLAVSRWAI